MPPRFGEWIDLELSFIGWRLGVMTFAVEVRDASFVEAVDPLWVGAQSLQELSKVLKPNQQMDSAPGRARVKHRAHSPRCGVAHPPLDSWHSFYHINLCP